MVTKTILKLLSNAKSGLYNVVNKVRTAYSKEEELSTEEIKQIRSELRAVRKQLSIVEEEVE